MSEYPEDVVKKAAKAAHEIMGSYADNDLRSFLADVILNAQMEERERCAQVGYWVCANSRHVSLGDEVSDAILKGRKP